MDDRYVCVYIIVSARWISVIDRDIALRTLAQLFDEHVNQCPFHKRLVVVINGVIIDIIVIIDISVTANDSRISVSRSSRPPTILRSSASNARPSAIIPHDTKTCFNNGVVVAPPFARCCPSLLARNRRTSLRASVSSTVDSVDCASCTGVAGASSVVEESGVVASDGVAARGSIITAALVESTARHDRTSHLSSTPNAHGQSIHGKHPICTDPHQGRLFHQQRVQVDRRCLRLDGHAASRVIGEGALHVAEGKERQ